MRNRPIVVTTLFAILGWAVSLYAANRESFTGTAARSGTFKRPLLDVNGKRYELQPSDKAEASVTDILKKFSEGDTGRYVAKGTRGTVKGKEGIIIDSIVPATAPAPKPVPSPSNPIPAKTPPAVSSTNPQVTVSVVTVGKDRYTVYHYDDLIARRCSFVIPEGLKRVRGLLVHGCYSGGDSRYDWKDCEYYRQFMHLHGFAYVGNTFAVGPLFGTSTQPADTSVMAKHRAIFDSFEESVKVVATASQHPEMIHAPYAGVGFSAGGGNALNLMCFAPEKTIAAVSYCAPYLFKRRITGPPSDELLHVPSIAITGEEEGFNVPLPLNVDPATGPARIDEVFLPHRPKGATYAWLERQGQGHEYFENRQDVLGMPFLDAAVRARYPKDGDVTNGPIKLSDVDPATGWIADNTTWKNGLTKIVPASEFKGDLGHSSWLMNEDLAFIYRSYSTYDNPLTITSPGNCWPTMPALEPGSDVPIVVDASQFRNWKTIAFYDGAKKLGEIASGAAPRFTATDLTPGYHVFSILATDDDGNVRTADPKLVIVKPVRVASTTETSENSGTPAASEVTVLTTFPADRGPGYKMVPDTQGAVGPNHVVDFDGLNFVVHDKETGKVLVKKSQREFWASVEPAGTLIAPNPWDPRFLYDSTSGRWIGIIASDGHGHGFLAVSTSSDPTKPWKGVILPMDKQDLGFKLGVDKNGLYATYASAEQGRDIHTLHDCIAIPKDDLLASEGPSLANLVTFTRLEHDSFPATDLNPEKASGDPEVILNKEFGNDCGQLYMYKITWQGKTASISEKQVIPLGRKYRSPNTTVEAATAPQPSPGMTIRAPRRTIAVAQYGDSVYQCNNAKLDDASPWGVFWCEVRVSDGVLLQEGIITDPDCDYLIPSLAVDKDGNVGIGCTRTSATEFPSVYVTMRAADDPKGQMRRPVLAVPGTTYYRVTNPHRFGTQFGNYSATCIDPTNPGVFWTCQEYADSTTPDQWCTAWAAFRRSDQLKDHLVSKATLSQGQATPENKTAAADENAGGIASIIETTKSGQWSDQTIWKDGRVPGTGARVLIRSGHDVKYDVVSDQAIRGITISGRLSFATDKDTLLNVGLINIQAGDKYTESGFDCDVHQHRHGADNHQSALEVGTSGQPVDPRHTAMIRLVYSDGMDKESCPAIVCCGGRMEFHGAPLSRTWVKLGQPARVGDSTIALDEEVTGWRIGDQLVLTATTRQNKIKKTFTAPSLRGHSQTEERRITAINGDRISLDRPLEFDHVCDGVSRGDVANLSRNVVVESADPEVTRGHTMYHVGSAGSISYAEFRHLGKPGVLGRYSLHYHLVGDTMRGSSVIGASIWDSGNRWLTIHGTNYLVVRDCVGYQSQGHGFFMEDGTEVYNVLDRNLAVHAFTAQPLPKQVIPFDKNDGSGFWWANSLNTFTRNVAAECDEYGYFFQAAKTPEFDPVLPIRQPDGSLRKTDIRTLPFVRFEDNEAHCHRRHAFNLGGGVPFGEPNVGGVGPDAKHPFVIRNFRVWNFHWAIHPVSPSVMLDGFDAYDGDYGIWRPEYVRHSYRELSFEKVKPELHYAFVNGESPVGRTDFPAPLTPIDDLPPTTVITHVLAAESGKLLVRGTTSDNGQVSEVTVNGHGVNELAPNYAEWELTLDAPPDGKLTALSKDAAGNVEQTPHERIVEVH